MAEETSSTHTNSAKDATNTNNVDAADANNDVDIERDAAQVLEGKNLPWKLIKFRSITGIHTTGTFLNTKGARRAANNLGIYSRIIDEETATKRKYTVVSFMIETTFLLQIAIAAAVTALAASGMSHIVITVLGSINTVIAGVQTYLKGQGLPNRVQQYGFGLRKLREHIEDLERHFAQPGCKLDIDHEIKEIAAMYRAVRQTEEDNKPDTYKAMGGAGAKLLTAGNVPAKDKSATGDENETTEETPLLKTSGGM